MVLLQPVVDDQPHDIPTHLHQKWSLEDDNSGMNTCLSALPVHCHFSAINIIINIKLHLNSLGRL